MRGNRCEVYINDVKSKLFPLGSSGCRSNLPAALFGMTVSINEAGKEKENITKQRDSKKIKYVYPHLVIGNSRGDEAHVVEPSETVF